MNTDVRGYFDGLTERVLGSVFEVPGEGLPACAAHELHLRDIRAAAEVSFPVTYKDHILIVEDNDGDITEILAAIRENPFLSDTPVIILSSMISATDRELIEKYNVARHMMKPVDLDAFLEVGNTVRQVLTERQILTAEEGKS